MSRNHFYGNRVDEKGDIVNDKKIKIGGATGFWGETDMAMSQFFTEGDLNYIVFDYLAEITMSILARARASDPALGYATDFVSAMVKPNLQRIADSGVKLISNAGGVNPEVHLYRRYARQNAGPQYPLYRRDRADIAGRHRANQGSSLHTTAHPQKWRDYLVAGGGAVQSSSFTDP